MEKKKEEVIEMDIEKNKFSIFVDQLLHMAIIYFVFAMIVTIIFQTVLMLSSVPTGSMSGSIEPGDVIISTRFFSEVKAEDISRYDVLIFNAPDGDGTYIKRVIGLPGETIEVRDNGKVYADGVELDDSFIKEPMRWDDNSTYVVPEDCFFFMGDNRNNSYDSRYWDKYISTKDILAKKSFTICNVPFLKDEKA